MHGGWLLRFGTMHERCHQLIQSWNRPIEASGML
jgi:hypothetical protein